MIYFITGNPHKLAELASALPKHLAITHKKLELEEIQSLDLHQIVRHKLRQAYAVVQQPVMVEDVSAELENLRGLPGPFIKFFNQQLGNDALYQLTPGGRVTITCCMGYYDGAEEILVDGTVHGTVVEPRGHNGFGFDCCVLLDGQTKTYAELSSAEKNTISHRGRAAALMATALAEHSIC